MLPFTDIWNTQKGVMKYRRRKKGRKKKKKKKARKESYILFVLQVTLQNWTWIIRIQKWPVLFQTILSPQVPQFYLFSDYDFFFIYSFWIHQWRKHSFLIYIFYFLSVISVFKRWANFIQLPKYSETLRRKISLFQAFRY